MPQMSDPLGAPQIVTGAQYMDALARLGYNVENMSSPIPLMTKIAGDAANLLDLGYQRNLEYKQAQAKLAYSTEQTRSLKDQNDLLDATFDNRVKASDLDLQQKQYATELQKGTLQNQIDMSGLLLEAQKQKNKFAADTDPLHEQILQAQANTAKTQNDQYQKAVQDQNAATAKWQTEYQNFPQALNNPNYQSEADDWMTKNGDLVFNPATSKQVAALKQVQDGIYNAQASTQVNGAMRNELIQNQKEGLMPLVVNPDSLNQDQKQDWIVKSNLQRTYQKLQAAVNSLPEAGGTPQVQQLKQRLINFSDQVQAHMRDQDEINNIKSGQNPNVNPNGQERAEIARALQDTATYLDLTGKQKPAELSVEPPKKVGEGPAITARGTLDQLRAIGWLDEKGNYIGPGAKPAQPAPGTQPLGADEQAFRNRVADATIAQAPGNAAVREIAEAYRRGQLTSSGFTQQISRFFQPKATPGGQYGGLVTPGGIRQGYQAGGLVDPMTATDTAQGMQDLTTAGLLAGQQAAAAQAPAGYQEGGQVTATNDAPAALPIPPRSDPSQWPRLQPMFNLGVRNITNIPTTAPTSLTTPTPTPESEPGTIAKATPAQTPAVTTGPVTNPQMLAGIPQRSTTGQIVDVSGQPVLRGLAYGPKSEGATAADQRQVKGAWDQPLQAGDLAVSPNQQGRYPLRSRVNVVDRNGRVVYANMQVADTSMIDSKHPTTDTFEIWNGPSLGPGYHLVPVGAETQSYQAGGPVTPGSTDTVPAMLTPGEFVINRNAANRIGTGNLEAINQGSSMPMPTSQYPTGRREVSAVPIRSSLPYSSRQTAVISAESLT